MDWSENFEGIRNLSPHLRDTLISHSELLKFKKNDTIFSAHQKNDRLMFLIDGTVRVKQVNAQGREIVLFRAVAGENCVMTTAGLLSDNNMAADGVAETDVTAAAISKSNYNHLMSESEEFRNFVLAAYNKRIRDLFRVVDEVAFGRMDIRLAAKLVNLSAGQNTLKITHQDLANELGTAREVISRLLNEFQKRDWVRQSRGQIEILNLPALKALKDEGE